MYADLKSSTAPKAEVERSNGRPYVPVYTQPRMRSRAVERVIKTGAVVLAFAVSSALALKLGGGGLWRGLTPIAAAASNAGEQAGPYDLTQLKVVNEDAEDDPRQVRRPEAREAEGHAPVGAQLRPARRGAGHRPPRRGRADGQGPRRHAGEGVPRRQRARPLGRVARASARSSRFLQDEPAAAPRSISARSSTPRATACSTRSIRTACCSRPRPTRR